MAIKLATIMDLVVMDMRKVDILMNLQAKTMRNMKLARSKTSRGLEVTSKNKEKPVTLKKAREMVQIMNTTKMRISRRVLKLNKREIILKKKKSTKIMEMTKLFKLLEMIVTAITMHIMLAKTRMRSLQVK